MTPACARSRSCARTSSRPTFSPARRSRTPSSPIRRSAARPMRRSTSTPSPGTSASSSTITDWEKVGYDVPLLVNMQPAGFYLGEEYYRAGGLPAVMNELLKAGRIHADALTINGKTMGENVKRAKIKNDDVIRTYEKPMKEKAGFKVLHGNLFDSAIMKTSVISEEFRKRYLVESEGPERLRRPRRRVRRAGGLSPPHRRSEAQDRREHHAVHPRHRADRLSGRGGSREHAAAGGAHQERRHWRCPASATAASPARRPRRRSSTPRRKRRPAAGSPC